MNKFSATLLVGVLLTANLLTLEALPRKRSKRFFSSFFGGVTTTEPPATSVVPTTSQPVYFIPRPNDTNIPPSFIPAVPVRYFTTANGQHYIAVRPVLSEDGYGQQPPLSPHWSTNNIPVVKKSKSRKPPKKVLASHFLGLSSSEVLELNQLAQLIGVKDMHDLPPLEEVMTLLGTTSKSETIKAVRDYASTPGGLELIKDYVLSYQPVKRMDTFQDEKSANEIGADELSNEVYADHTSIDEKLNLNDFNGFGFPIIGYSQDNTLGSRDNANSTPAPESGFFAGLKSFFTFWSPVESAQTDAPVNPDPSNAVTSGQIPLSGAKFIPHFIIPIRPLIPADDKYSVNSNLRQYPLTPFIQDMNPFVMRPVPQQQITPNTPIADSKYNEAHIYHDETPERDIKGDANQQSVPVRVSSPEAPGGQVYKQNLDDADLSIMGTTTTMEAVTSTSEVVPETMDALSKEATTPIITGS